MREVIAQIHPYLMISAGLINLLMGLWCLIATSKNNAKFGKSKFGSTTNVNVERATKAKEKLLNSMDTALSKEFEWGIPLKFVPRIVISFRSPSPNRYRDNGMGLPS